MTAVSADGNAIWIFVGRLFLRAGMYMQDIVGDLLRCTAALQTMR